MLAGNCNATVGAVSGTGDQSALGVVWLDAHADFHTPETTESGFLDGMGLATLSSQCWHTLAHVKIPSYAPVAPARVILVGAHAVDAQEAQRLRQAGVTCVEANLIRSRSAGEVPEALKRALNTLSRRGVREIHLHVDMDVHDPASIVANSWSVPGGLTADEVIDVVGVIVGAFKIVGMSVASLDPDVDRTDEATQAAVRLLRTVVRSVSEGKSASRRGVGDRGAAKRRPDADVRRAPSGGA